MSSEVQSDYFKNLSQRRRVPLVSLLTEYGTLKTIQERQTRHLSLLLEDLYEHETSSAAQPSAQMIGSSGQPPGYQDVWTTAFLETLAEYKNLTSYHAIVENFESFRGTLRSKTLPVPRKLRTDITKRDANLKMALADLSSLGYSPSVLGQMEAHWQIRRLAQVYFGRYSAEMRDAAGPDMADDTTPPAPELSLFNRRKSVQSKLMGQIERVPGQFAIDSAVYLVMYLDWLSETSPLGHWQDETRRLYEQKLLLMPGLPGTDIVLHRIDEDMGDRGKYLTLLERQLGNAQNALYQSTHLRAELETFARKPVKDLGKMVESIVDEDGEHVHSLRAEHALIRNSISPSLNLMNVTRGSSYAGDISNPSRFSLASSILSILDMYVAPDIYADRNINHNWQPILKEWAAEAAELMVAKKSPLRKSTRLEDKLADAQKRAKLALEKLAAAEEALLTEDQKAARKAKQEKRQQKKEKKRILSAEGIEIIKSKETTSGPWKKPQERKKRVRQTITKKDKQPETPATPLRKLTPQEKLEMRIAAAQVKLERMKARTAARIQQARLKEEAREEKQRRDADKRREDRAKKNKPPVAGPA